MQAMSHAYMGIGKPQKAVAVLERAIEMAQHMKPQRLYSSLEYRYVPLNRFMTEAQQLLARAQKATTVDGASTTVN